MDDDDSVNAFMMIPSDIITEILCRLPSKSVGRSRCVSKGWLSLLTQPEFIKTHRKTLNRTNHIFVELDMSTIRFVLYSHPFDDHDPYILNPATKLPIDFTGGTSLAFRGSCDGLYLVSQRSDHHTYHTLTLLNPTTGESVQLPQPGYYPRNLGAPDYISHGIGYDSVTDDYKVVTLAYFRSVSSIYNGYTYTYDEYRNLITQTFVYSLRSNTWRQLIIDSPYDLRRPYDFYASDVVYVNGFLHWKGRKKDNISVIVAFSLADESFSEVPIPINISSNVHSNFIFRYCQLAVLGGKLAMHLYSVALHVKLEVWLMNEYGVKESWTKIPLPDMFDNDDFSVLDYRIFDDNGKIRVANGIQMWIYDFERTNFSRSVYWDSRRFGLFDSYVENLLSLKRKDTTHAEQIIDMSAEERQNSEVALPKNLNPIYHPFCNKFLRFANILNDKKATLRKKRKEGKAKVKDKRKRVKKSILVVGEADLTNDDVSLGDSKVAKI